MTKKPIRLRRFEPKERIVFWVFVSVAMVLILVGWALTLRLTLSNDIGQARSQIDVSLEKITETVNNLSEPVEAKTSETKNELSEKYDQFLQAIEEEKSKQEEPSTP